MPVPYRIREYLDQQQVPYAFMPHSTAYTAQETAHHLHVPGRRFAKAVLTKGETKFYLAVVEAQDQVDLKELARLAGEEKLDLGTEEEMDRMFPECETGAMPPLGDLYNMPVYVDAGLEEDAEIVFNAGTHEDAIRMTYGDFKKVAHPVVGAFARGSWIHTA